MNVVVIIIGTLLGLLVGSFLNVVALRFNTGKSIGGRSECFSCSHVLSWRDLFPVFSFLVQRGRCRYCSSHISPDNIYAEIITALFFGLITARGLFFGVSLLALPYLIATLFLFIVFSVLIVIFLYDLKHKIIPDTLSVTFGVLGIFSIFFFEWADRVFVYVGLHIPDWSHVLAGIVIPLPFVLLWMISKGRWIGLGDPKLMVGMGFLLGIPLGISAVFVSFWIGAFVALVAIFINVVYKKRLLRQGKKSIMKSELPFAPFLIVGTLITAILYIHVFPI
ncbi:prepilin peptidase [Patescibacteria group bacterium]|nr:prepilin peptidase [Patescibacteria group bacterium]